MAILLIMIPYRYKLLCAFAFIYGRNPNDWIVDKFGIERIKARFRSQKSPKTAQIPALDGVAYIVRGNVKIKIPYPKGLFKFYRSLPNFLHLHRFGAVEKKFEQSYIRNVKSKLLDNQERDEYVDILTFNKLQHKYDVLIYNLHTRQDLNIAQLERLHMDPKTGVLLSRRETIKLRLNFLGGKME